MTRPLFIAATLITLGGSALSPIQAQDADGNTVERVLRAHGMSLRSQHRDVAECGWLRDASTTDPAIAGTTHNSRKGVHESNAAPVPNVWRLYHSLGEIYAAAGDTKLAIRCYEKSVLLNPEDESGLSSLVKLPNQDAIRR